MKTIQLQVNAKRNNLILIGVNENTGVITDCIQNVLRELIVENVPIIEKRF